MYTIFLLLTLFQTTVTAETIQYRGEAKTKSKIVYTEDHTVTVENNKTIKAETVYKDPQGNILAKFSNDFTKSIHIPENTMQDIKNKSKHGIRYSGETPIMFNQDRDDKEKTKEILLEEYKNQLVVGGQGLHYYFIAHFEEVIKKKNLKLRFMIPGKLDSYDFYLKVKRVETEKVYIEVEIDSWLLKLFAPKLEMIYEIKTKRLLKYKGLSNIQMDSKPMNVEINYRY